MKLYGFKKLYGNNGKGVGLGGRLVIFLVFKELGILLGGTGRTLRFSDQRFGRQSDLHFHELPFLTQRKIN